MRGGSSGGEQGTAAGGTVAGEEGEDEVHTAEEVYGRPGGGTAPKAAGAEAPRLRKAPHPGVLPKNIHDDRVLMKCGESLKRVHMVMDCSALYGGVCGRVPVLLLADFFSITFLLNLNFVELWSPLSSLVVSIKLWSFCRVPFAPPGMMKHP